MRSLRTSLLTLCLAITAAGCGDAASPVDPAEPDPGTDKADVGGALDAIPAWSAVSPPVTESRDEKRGDPTGDASFLSASDDRYNPAAVCVATPHSLAKNPRKIIE